MFTISSDNVMTLSKGDTAHFTVVVKNADGTPYTEQYADLIEQRKQWRAEIRRLQKLPY